MMAEAPRKRKAGDCEPTPPEKAEDCEPNPPDTPPSVLALAHLNVWPPPATGPSPPVPRAFPAVRGNSWRAICMRERVGLALMCLSIARLGPAQLLQNLAHAIAAQNPDDVHSFCYAHFTTLLREREIAAETAEGAIPAPIGAAPPLPAALGTMPAAALATAVAPAPPARAPGAPAPSPPVLRPLPPSGAPGTGRGRAATTPAWMTSAQQPGAPPPMLPTQPRPGPQWSQMAAPPAVPQQQLYYAPAAAAPPPPAYAQAAQMPPQHPYYGAPNSAQQYGVYPQSQFPHPQYTPQYLPPR